MMSMIEYLERMVNKLEEADFTPDQVVIAISPVQERHLIDNLREHLHIHVQTAHHSEYKGWRIIVKGEKP